jgi:serine/threonine-protein kinase ATR
VHADKITNMMDQARMKEELRPYQWLTAFPQIASRLGHRHAKVKAILVKLLAMVINAYPRQALWPMFGLMQSNRDERRRQAAEVTQRALVSRRANGGLGRWRDRDRPARQLAR